TLLFFRCWRGLTPGNRLKFYILPLRSGSGFRQRAPASLTPAKRLKFWILRFAQDFGSGLAPSATLRVTPAKRLKLSKSAENDFGAASRAVFEDRHTYSLP